MRAEFRPLVISVAITLGSVLVGTSANALTVEQWKQDLATLRSAIAAHPNPSLNASKADLEQHEDALAVELSSMNDPQVIARMATLVAMLGDGHSRLTLPLPEGADLFGSHGKIEPAKIPPFASFPIRLTGAADGLVVTRATAENKDLLGAEWIGIGNQSAPTIEAAVRPLVHGDNRNQRDYLLPNFIVVPEVLEGVGITAKTDPVPWKFRLADGKEVSRNLAAIPDVKSLKWVELTETGRPSVDSRHWLKKLPHGVIYARLTDILNDPHETVEQFAQKLFAEVESAPDAILVLDVRDNPGGDNTLDDAIVRGAIRSKRLWEPGSFFVLINPGTFSAASNLVTLLERWTPAIFVGEPTGGAPNGFGDPKRTVLPNSGLTVLVSTLYWQLSSPKDKREATEPLLAVRPTVASLRSHSDAALELVKSLTEEPVSTSGKFSGWVTIPGQRIEIKFNLSKDRATLDIPTLQVARQPLKDLEQHGAVWKGNATLGDHVLGVRGRLTGRHFLGWIKLDGRPYAFVTETDH
jgi:hypothetical protein